MQPIGSGSGEVRAQEGVAVVQDKTIIKLWAMSLITGLEAINMFVFGADSTILVGAVAAIAGLAGYAIGGVKK